MKSLIINKILVPINFSEPSLNPLQTAMEMAKRHKAMVKLLFIHHISDKFAPEINLIISNDIIKKLADTTKLLKEVHHVHCNYTYIMGKDVANCIVKQSNVLQADIIIMGKNFHPDTTTTPEDSNFYRVIRKSTCPVLIVPPGKQWNQFNNILFPVRPEFSMLEKYAMVKEIISKNNAVLHLLNFRNPSYIHELQIISKIVQILKMKLLEDNVRTSLTYYFKDDKFADRVLQSIRDNRIPIDLLAISLEQNEDSGTLHFSSYAGRILREANVPVLIVKPQNIVDSTDILVDRLEKQSNN